MIYFFISFSNSNPWTEDNYVLPLYSRKPVLNVGKNWIAGFFTGFKPTKLGSSWDLLVKFRWPGLVSILLLKFYVYAKFPLFFKILFGVSNESKTGITLMITSVVCCYIYILIHSMVYLPSNEIWLRNFWDLHKAPLCWQRIMRLGFDWDTTDMSILLLAKLAKPFMGTARIVINSLHIKGDVCKVAFFFICSLSSFSVFWLLFIHWIAFYSLSWCQFWMGGEFCIHLCQFLKWELELPLEVVEANHYLPQNCLAFLLGWWVS